MLSHNVMKGKRKEKKYNPSTKNQQKNRNANDDTRKQDDTEAESSNQTTQNEKSTEVTLETNHNSLQLSSLLSRRREKYYDSKRSLFSRCLQLLTSPRLQDISNESYDILKSLLPLECELQFCEELYDDCCRLESSSQFVYDLYEIGYLEDRLDTFRYLVKIQETLPSLKDKLSHYIEVLKCIHNNYDITLLMFIICKSMNYYHCLGQEEIHRVPICFLSRLTCYRTNTSSLCLLRYGSFFSYSI